MPQLGTSSAPAVGLFPIVHGDLLAHHALGLLSPSPVPLHMPRTIPFRAGGATAAEQKGHGAACPGETCCGFSPACLCARVATNSHNRLSTLQAGFSHNPERITEKSNNKHILLLNSCAPSASDLPDGPWQPIVLREGLVCFPAASVCARSHPGMCTASQGG